MLELEKYTLDEIISMNDTNLLNKYLKEIESLKYNRINRRVIEQNYGSSLIEIINSIQEEEEKIRSYELFPGDLVYFYPSIKESHARKQLTCDFSGSIIYPGSLYINYRPLLENITTGNCYVLKRTIRVEQGCAYNLPTTISEFEKFNLNMKIENDFDGINFSKFNSEMLDLQKLKNKKRKEVRI